MKKIVYLFLFTLLHFMAHSQFTLLSPDESNLIIKTNSGYYGTLKSTNTFGLLQFYSSTNNYTGFINAGFLGDFHIGAANTTSNFHLYVNGATRMSILTSGRVGIGTTSPSSALEISSTVANTDLQISSNCGFCSTRLSFISDNEAANEWRPGYIASGDNGVYTGRLDFYTNGTGSNNKFGSILGMSIMNRKVSVGGAFVTTIPAAMEIHESGTYGVFQYSSDNSKFWEHYVSSFGNLELYANGNLKGIFDSSTGAYTQYSDRNAKTNIAALSPVLEKVMLLKPSSYQYKENNPENRNSIGLIAQEIEALFPEFVYKNQDRNTDGIVYSVDYAGLSVVALKAIQEQQTIIGELKQEIKKLKGN